MMRLAAAAALAAAVTPGLGAAVLQSGVAVDGWRRAARAPGDAVLTLTFALRAPGAAERVEKEVVAVSDPKSPRYGQHLTPAELGALAAPPRSAQQAVLQWLKASGVGAAKLSRWGDRVTATATAALWERVLSTEWHRWERGDQSVLQAEDLHAPQTVADAVNAVFGAHGTPLPPAARGPLSAPAAKPKVTPDVLRQVYNITAVDVAPKSAHRMAVAEFQTQTVALADLQAFFKQYLPEEDPSYATYTCVGNTCEPPRGLSGMEAALDLEYIKGVAPKVAVEVWMYNSSQWCTDLKEWTSAILDHDDPPRVFSISYGVQGNVSLDKTQGCSVDIMQNIEQDFAKIAARGVTLVFASGDSGSGGETIFKVPLWPVWPGSAPHVTAVGATTFISPSDPKSGEKAVGRFGSGGGFSWNWPTQSWQKEAVSTYLGNSAVKWPRDQDYPRGGRATPDLSALGDGYQVITDGRTSSVGGTSASAPAFAGMVALLNEARRQAGKAPLGFLNPVVYQIAGSGFTDVTQGNNRVDRSGIHVSEGYDCTPGWDAVTGWGTPNFGRILDHVLSLP